MTMFDFMYPRYQIDKPIRLIELFSGVSSQAMALRDLGADFEHYLTCEWEVNAVASCKAIHFPDDNTDYSKEYTEDQLVDILFDMGISNDGKVPLTHEQIAAKKNRQSNWLRTTYNNIMATHNIVNIMAAKGSDLKIVDTDKYVYLLTYSFPCQDLSLAGKRNGMQKGSGTRSGLLWEVERLLNEVENLPQILLMENVPQVVSDENVNDFYSWCDFLKSKGYQNYSQILNAKDYGVAQNRERCFMVSILGDYNYKFPQPIPLETTMKDYLEPEVDECYYINTEKAQKLIQDLVESGQLGDKNVSNTVRGGAEAR
jgi:DNA (cytosine-5)-methyltransferase 1